MRGRSSSNVGLFDLSQFEDDEETRQVIENRQETLLESVLAWIAEQAAYFCGWCRRPDRDEQEEDVLDVENLDIESDFPDAVLRQSSVAPHRAPSRNALSLPSAEGSVYVGGTNSSECSSPASGSTSSRFKEKWIMRQGVLVKMNSGAELVPKGNTGGSGTDDGYVASLLENLDRCRGEVGTFEQLYALLDVCNPHLPAQIQAQRIAPTEPEGVKPVAYQLTINGPLRAVPHPEVLSIAEDILVEDCQDDFCLVNIVCNDILFNRRMAFLPPTDPHAKDLAENKTESLTRLLSFLKNVTDAFSGSLRDYAFTRCDISSLDFGHTFPIPSLFPPLHSLMFTHCKLTASHVAALLEWARRENSEAASRQTRCFQSLHTLQLCGAVTAQCVDDLLDYFLDELDQNQFRFLRLPADLVEGAKRHAFCQTNMSFRVEEIAFT